jgi:hypothetical protein
MRAGGELSAPGFYLALALGVAGWIVFLGLAMAGHLAPAGIGGVFREHYPALFLGLRVFLMALTPFLVGASLLYLWRGELSAVRSTLLLLAFLGGSLLLLRLFQG